MFDCVTDITLTPDDPVPFDTLENVKTALGIADGANDANLTSYIAAAAFLIEAYCGRPMQERAVVETIVGPIAAQRLTLRYFNLKRSVVPVVTVDGVEIPITDVFINYRAGIVSRADTQPIVGKKIVVEYTIAAPDVAACKLATVELVRDMLATIARGPGVIEQTLDGVGSVRFAAEGASHGVRAILPLSAARHVVNYVVRGFI